jgi:Cu-Zn family superoxide dismutase
MRSLARIACFGLGLSAAAAIASLHTATSELAETSSGDKIGTIQFTDSKYGLRVIPELKGLSPGLHAVHIHENPDCNDAGDHFDPGKTGKHEGPYGEGHLGDLPNITVEADGSATIEVLAPRVLAEDVVNRAVIIHEGADRYDLHSSHTHGKGGLRMYCGVIR